MWRNRKCVRIAGQRLVTRSFQAQKYDGTRCERGKKEVRDREVENDGEEKNVSYMQTTHGRPPAPSAKW
jgi:hypothetical protein